MGVLTEFEVVEVDGGGDIDLSVAAYRGIVKSIDEDATRKKTRERNGAIAKLAKAELEKDEYRLTPDDVQAGDVLFPIRYPGFTNPYGAEFNQGIRVLGDHHFQKISDQNEWYDFATPQNIYRSFLKQEQSQKFQGWLAGVVAQFDQVTS